MHELAHAFFGIHLPRDEVALPLADGLVGGLERGRKQPVFVADVVIEQGLVDARTPRDLVDARAVEPLEGEFGDRSLEDLLLGKCGCAPHPLARLARSFQRLVSIAAARELTRRTARDPIMML